MFAKRLVLLGGLLLGAAQPVVQAPAQAQANVHEASTLELAVGEQKVLPTQGVKSFSEGVKGIVDIRLTSDASKFVIIGLRPGTTTLLLLMNDGSERHYAINVYDPNAGEKNAVLPETPNAVTPQANIRLDLYFVQFDRNYSHNLGVNIPTTLMEGTFEAAFDLKTASLGPTSAIVRSQLMPQLDLAQGQGWAKVLRHVAVITTNGTEATFDSGGFYNVLVATAQATGVQSIKFGTSLGVVPRYDEETHRLQLAVTAEVSDLTSTGAEVPGRSRSTLTTVVNLELGESLAVAGLSARSEEHQRQGIAALSQIPILGALFGTRARRTRDIENVVFVVPSVVEPLKASRGREFVDRALENYRKYEGDSLAKPLYPESPVLDAKSEASRSSL